MGGFRTALADLLSSKKVLTTLAGLIVAGVAKLGFQLDTEFCIAVLSSFAVLVAAQGAADHGKEAAKHAAGAAAAANDNSSATVDATADKSWNKQAGRVDLGLLASLALISSIAVIGSLLLFVPSCVGAKKLAGGVASSVVDCTRREVVKQVRELRPLGSAMLANAVENGKVNWGPVRDVAREFTTDVGRCVFADAVTRLLAPPADGAPRTSPLEVDPVATRAGARELAASLYGGVTFKTENGDL